MTAPIAAHGDDAGAADAAGRLPLRVPRHRERPRRRPRVPQGAREEQPARRRAAAVGNATLDAIDVLHRHGMFVVGGLIVGNPDDTRESIDANLAFAREYVDWPYIQHPTPYPGHADDARLPRARTHRQPTRRGVRRHDRRDAQRAPRRRGDRVHALAGRALDEGAAHAGGVPARSGVRAAQRPPDARAHLPRHDLALGARPRGAHRDAFRRYRAIRQRERDYIDWPDPHPPSSDLDVQDAAARPHVPVVVRAG